MDGDKEGRRMEGRDGRNWIKQVREEGRMEEGKQGEERKMDRERE